MELSYFLAQLMGVSVVLLSVAGIVRPQIISAAVKDFNRESFSTLTIGFIVIIAGLAVILSHNIWDGTWRVWVTLIGWSSLLKGFAYIVAPQSLINMSRTMLKNTSRIRGYLFVSLLLGIYLAFKGFGF